MKITVVYNRVESLTFGKPEDVLADQDTVETARGVADTLERLGYQVDLFEIEEGSQEQLKTYPTDLFFNNAFGIGNVPKTESQVARLLEETHVPYCGSNAGAIDLTTDKVATKKLLRKYHLPTPNYQAFIDGEMLSANLHFPLIMKPAGEDCSLGINPGSVLASKRDIARRIASLSKIYPDPVLVEEYIAGREISVTILGNGQQATALPISELVFGRAFKNRYKILDFVSKWYEETPSYKAIQSFCPAPLDQSLESKIKEVALRAYFLTHCTDFARIDIRLSPDGTPYILEVNANPAVGPKDGATHSARAAGYSYQQFLQKIIDLSLERFSGH